MTDWRDHANCIGLDADLFFPERGKNTNEAKRVCAACTVRNECAEYALNFPETFGIWGGLSPVERKRIRGARRRRQVA